MYTYELITQVKTITDYRTEPDISINATAYNLNGNIGQQYTDLVSDNNGIITLTTPYPVLVVHINRELAVKHGECKGLTLVNANTKDGIKIEGQPGETISKNIKLKGFLKQIKTVPFYRFYIESSEEKGDYPSYTNILQSDAINAGFDVHVRNYESETDIHLLENVTFETVQKEYSFDHDFNVVSITVSNALKGLRVRSRIDGSTDFVDEHICEVTGSETFDLRFLSTLTQDLYFPGYDYSVSYTTQTSITVSHVFETIASESFNCTVLVKNIQDESLVAGEFVELLNPLTRKVLKEVVSNEFGEVLFEEIEPESIVRIKGTIQEKEVYNDSQSVVLYVNRSTLKTTEPIEEPNYDDNLIPMSLGTGYSRFDPSLLARGTVFNVLCNVKKRLDDEVYPYNFIINAYGDKKKKESNKLFVDLEAGNWEFAIQLSYDGVVFKFEESKKNLDLFPVPLLTEDGDLLVPDKLFEELTFYVTQVAAVEFYLSQKYISDVEGFITLQDHNQTTIKIYTGDYLTKNEISPQEARSRAGTAFLEIVSEGRTPDSNVIYENSIFYEITEVSKISVFNTEDLYIMSQTCVEEETTDNNISLQPFLNPSLMARCEVISHGKPPINIVIPNSAILTPMKLDIQELIDNFDKKTGVTTIVFDKLYPHLKIEIVEEGVYAYSQINELEKTITSSISGFCLIKDETGALIDSQPLYEEVVSDGETGQRIRDKIEFSELPDPIEEESGSVYGFIRNPNGSGVPGLEVIGQDNSVSTTDENGLFYFADKVFPFRVTLPDKMPDVSYTYYSSLAKPAFKYPYNIHTLNFLDQYRSQQDLLMRNYFYELFAATVYLKKRGLIGHDFLTLDRLEDKSQEKVGELLTALSLITLKRTIKPTDYRMLYNLYRLTPEMILDALKALGLEVGHADFTSAFNPQEDFPTSPPENLEGYRVDCYMDYTNQYSKTMKRLIDYFTMEYKGESDV